MCTKLNVLEIVNVDIVNRPGTFILVYRYIYGQTRYHFIYTACEDRVGEEAALVANHAMRICEN